MTRPKKCPSHLNHKADNLERKDFAIKRSAAFTGTSKEFDDILQIESIRCNTAAASNYDLML